MSREPKPTPAQPGRPKSVVARRFLEGGVITSLILCGVLTLLVTVAIVYTLGRETYQFFEFQQTILDNVQAKPVSGTIRGERGEWIFELDDAQKPLLRFVEEYTNTSADPASQVRVTPTHQHHLRIPLEDGQTTDIEITAVRDRQIILADAPPPGLTEVSGVQVIRDAINNSEFFFGLHWSPLLGNQQHFGVWPLVVGTLMITLVAMLVAGPLGIITAIWLSEYAPYKLRNVLKPVLEILAGVPTVVLGFFALTVITPTLRFAWWPVPSRNADGTPMLGGNGEPLMEALNPFNIDVYNVLSAGIAVGILTLPIITSLAEDALRAVPRALREGSYGLGSTRFETSTQVVFPAALSGIVAAFLLAIARCVGETMIVALAAGGTHVPLQYITDPPMVLNTWHTAGNPQASTTLRSLTAGQSLQSPPISVSAGAKIDEIGVTLRPGSTATTLHFAITNAAGETISAGTLPVDPPPTDQPITLFWEIPKSDISGLESKDVQQAKQYGVRLPSGTYTASVTAEGGTAQIAYLEVDGERYMSLGQRLAIPLDVRQSMQPMTGYLVQIFLGDTSNLGIEYYSSYAVAALLFVITFALTIIGHIIRVRFQQQYE